MVGMDNMNKRIAITVQHRRIREWIGYAFVTLCVVAVFLAVGKEKSGYHMDEMFTFGLSNHQFQSTGNISVAVEDCKSYTGWELWNEYLTTGYGRRFDYANVWENQTHDVHPPLYYVLIHTASSLFPNLNVKAIGFMVNIPLAVIVFWQLVWIISKLDINSKAAMILAGAFVLSNGFMNHGVVFFRMYGLLAVFMNFLIMIFLHYRAEEGSLSYYLLLGVVLAAGTLTQYYFLIFAFFACSAYAVFVILSKNWRKLAGSFATAGVSVCAAWRIFPAMRYHIFIGYRGKQAFANAASAGFLKGAWQYIDFIDVYIFGGGLAVLLTVIICVAIVSREGDGTRAARYPYVILIIPVCLFVLVISKIAPSRTLRYCVSSLGLLYAGLFGLLVKLAQRFAPRAHWVVLVMAVVMLFSGHREGMSNLFLEERDKIAMIQENSDLPCVFVYSDNWEIHSNLLELTNLDRIVFVRANRWEKEKNEICVEGPIIAYIPNEYPGLLASLKDSTGLASASELFSSGNETAYVLE